MKKILHLNPHIKILFLTHYDKPTPCISENADSGRPGLRYHGLAPFSSIFDIFDIFEIVKDFSINFQHCGT